MADIDELIKMTLYIEQKLCDISLDDRRSIYKLIRSTGFAEKKIQEKGNGSLFKWDDIPHETIIQIYKFVENKISKKIEQLDKLIEEPENTDE